MLKFDFDYAGFQERFGIQEHGNGSKSRKNKILLAFVKDQSVLLTGLVNPQVVRTAEMMDMACIVFVRGKDPDESIVNLAEMRGITLIKTKYRMYTACGRLYVNGLSGGTKI